MELTSIVGEITAAHCHVVGHTVYAQGCCGADTGVAGLEKQRLQLGCAEMRLGVVVYEAGVAHRSGLGCTNVEQ